MSNLFISFDLGTNSSGNSICKEEIDALKLLGEEVITIGHDDIDPSKYGLPTSPFLQDYLCMNKVSKMDLSNIRLAHFYSTPFPNTISYLNARKIKTTITCAAHDKTESIKEFNNLGLQYPFNHISDQKLWNIYSGDIREADFVIAPSRLSAEFLKKEHAKNVEIISHGTYLPHRTEKISKKEFNIGYMGQFGPDKGVKYLIEGWSSLNYKDSQLILAGSQANNQIEQFIRYYAKKGGRFNLTGYVENIETFYNSISVYIQPSVSEGFGMEVLEAASYTVPIICSNGAGACDFIEDGVNGFIFEKRNVNELVDKIKYFRDNPNEIIKMGKNAQEKSLNYNWKIIKQQYMELWKKLLGV